MPTNWDIMNSDKCECWKLTRTIDGTDELPDHICSGVGLVSCVNWVRDFARLWPDGKNVPSVMSFGDRHINIGRSPLCFEYPGLDPNSAGMIYLVYSPVGRDAR